MPREEARMTFLSSLVIGRGPAAPDACAMLMSRSRLIVPPGAADHPLHPHAALLAVLRLEPGKPTQDKGLGKAKFDGLGMRLPPAIFNRALGLAPKGVRRRIEHSAGVARLKIPS
ncbi:hypothetical protein BOSE62_40731 [Bosea sp. 62]|nr:hypothetical protein BOSE46_120050 [Bosea sp. 46]VXB43045.1 hypothetical protein BOSE29B_110218 [Bosea sp. 29B]VXB86311.1 hypothetical protein BOSE125_160005 [Bosea sp. 125]VXC54840.1 hypothetical protein BOSE62_40731 [Bosea sp. 62]